MPPADPYRDTDGHPLALGDYVALEPDPWAMGLAVGRLAGIFHSTGGGPQEWYVVWGLAGSVPLTAMRPAKGLRWVDRSTVPYATRLMLGGFVILGKESTWGTPAPREE